MTLSIEVLPAPLGPMMARISPFRISNETSRMALMPPNESDMSSTDNKTSPALAGGAGGVVVISNLPPSHGGGGSTREARRGGVTYLNKKVHPTPARLRRSDPP